MLTNRWAMGRGKELLEASREGRAEKVEIILGQITKRSGPFPSLRRGGATINVQDEYGRTPLHLACLSQHKEIVRLLLSVDASANMTDHSGTAPLHYAAFNGNQEIIAMLLAHHPPVDIDMQTNNNRESALLTAARHGHIEVVKQLTAQGANVTLRDYEGYDALDLAAQFGKAEVVTHLLRVHPDMVDCYRPPQSQANVFVTTPMHIAVRLGHKQIVLELLAAGVDPNVYGTGRPRGENIPDLRDDGTPLHVAVFYSRASIVRILLTKGANLYVKNRDGLTVKDLLIGQNHEASRKIQRVIHEYEKMNKVNPDSEDERPRLSVSPTGFQNPPGKKAPETQKNTNNLNDSLLLSSSSSTINHPSQSFVKKLAQRCLGLKARFNSAPNISNTAVLDTDLETKLKQIDEKNNTNNTLHIGNSKFFKILLKKEDSGEIVCNDEFDTISLDRLGTLNRDSVVNRSNRSCPGFKTSLPNISENTELDDTHSVTDSVVITDLDSNMDQSLNEAVNINMKLSIFEPREMKDGQTIRKSSSADSNTLINECYESYEFSNSLTHENRSHDNKSIPKPSPRPTISLKQSNSHSKIYENVIITSKHTQPTPAARGNITSNKTSKAEENTVYENIVIKREPKPEPLKRTLVPSQSNESNLTLSSVSSSITSMDSMIDESNLEDIFISEKSKSFRHGNKLSLMVHNKLEDEHRPPSNASMTSGLSDLTQTSALENVDCSNDLVENVYLPMTGTLPKPERKPKILFRHKTFTNIEVDRNSLPKWDGDILKTTLASYHIRGTGHCIYKAPTVQEFINSFNRESLYKNVEPLSKTLKRDSYVETTICFCKPQPPKHHKSAEDLDKLEDEPKVTIDLDAITNRRELAASSFRCYCEKNSCTLHVTKRITHNTIVVKFSAIKKSISTPDITLESSPSTVLKRISLIRNKSMSSNLTTPYAIVSVEDIVNREQNKDQNLPDSPIYTIMSNPFPTISSSSSSTRPYSIKDITDVISLNSTCTATNPSCASDNEIKSLRKSSSSEYSGHWSLHTCNSNVTIKSDNSFKSCLEESSDENSSDTLDSDEDSDAETVKSDISGTKRPWVHSDSFRFGNKEVKSESVVIFEEDFGTLKHTDSINFDSSKIESGISMGSGSSSSVCEVDGIPRVDSDVSLGIASLERGTGVVGGVRSGLGRRRWDETEVTSEGDALSISSAASSCAPHHLGYHHDYSKVSPTPPKKPPRRNLSVSPTHANSPSSGYSYELRTHARSQDDLDEIQGAKIYLKHGRSVDQYVDGKLSYAEYEENHNPRVVPVPNPRPSLKNRPQPVAITAMYENVVIKEQNPRRKLRRSFGPQSENERMNERVRKYSNQEKSSLESLLDSQSMNSPSDCERYYEDHKAGIPLSPTHYEQPPTPDHPPPSARQAENSIHERIRPLSQLIMEVVEEIRIRKKSQGDISGNS